MTMDQFFTLGEGMCVNLAGYAVAPDAVHVLAGATVLADGSSPECEALCRSDPYCTGYMTHDTVNSVWSGGRTGSCGLLSGAGFEPTTTDGSKGSRCFWRHSS